MKILLMLLLLGSTDHEKIAQICAAEADTARYIMVHRQNDEPINRVKAIFDNDEKENQRIELAYMYPLAEDSYAKHAIIDIFQKKELNKCLSTYL